jgi:hypothetical protein
VATTPAVVPEGTAIFMPTKTSSGPRCMVRHRGLVSRC